MRGEEERGGREGRRGGREGRRGGREGRKRGEEGRGEEEREGGRRGEGREGRREEGRRRGGKGCCWCLISLSRLWLAHFIGVHKGKDHAPTGQLQTCYSNNTHGELQTRKCFTLQTVTTFVF